jgi:Ca-activated chloride channel family protein
MTVKLPAICLSVALLAAAFAPSAYATPDDDQDNSSVESVVVTATVRVRQGGAQDISYFRGQAKAANIPLPQTLTPEGLMGGYDLLIGDEKACDKVFCLQTEAMTADFATRPDDKLVVGIGFASNISADNWKRQPLNLVAVVDKSGSMDGQPLELVRESLRQILSQLRPGDQLSIVLYGDTAAVFMQPVMVTASNKDDIRARIDAIQSAGSTYMEAGLKVGYATAFASADGFKGSTRVMLFTDEQPNVGRTDAEGFMGMAEAASRQGIGLTTIGVGEQFDGPLATKVSSVRGGNLFFMSNKADIKSVFTDKLDTMVSELGYDVKLTFKPHAGYKISAVYGVPADVLGWQDGDSVTVTVPTVFFSTEGGGLFVTLARDPKTANLPAPKLGETALLDASMSYVSALDGKPAADTASIAGPSARPSDNLKLGAMLVDEYLLLQQATSRYHRDGDVDGSYKALKVLNDRLAQFDDPRIKPEREMVGDLLARTGQLAGYGGEPGVKKIRWIRLYGTWEVTRVNGEIAMRKGDTLELTEDNESYITRADDRLSDEDSTFEATNNALYIKGSGGILSYRFEGDSMILTHRDSGATVVLRRVEG